MLCKNNHPLTSDNIINSKTGPRCKTCQRLARMAHQAKKQLKYHRRKIEELQTFLLTYEARPITTKYKNIIQSSIEREE